MPNTAQISSTVATAYAFGFQTSDAPTIDGFSARNADLVYEAEVYSEAMDGEGFVTAIARTEAKVSASFGGYLTTNSINDTTSPLENYFTFLGDFFIIKGLTDPRKKGAFVEATVEAEHYAGVTAP